LTINRSLLQFPPLARQHKPEQATYLLRPVASSLFIRQLSRLSGRIVIYRTTWLYFALYQYKHNTQQAMSYSINRMTKNMTAGEFIKLVKTNPSAIKSSKVIPPKVGEKGFGKIHVELR
jgi:hypothetical protein